MGVKRRDWTGRNGGGLLGLLTTGWKFGGLGRGLRCPLVGEVRRFPACLSRFGSSALAGSSARVWTLLFLVHALVLALASHSPSFFSSVWAG
jgi:hypothetical protein